MSLAFSFLDALAPPDFLPFGHVLVSVPAPKHAPRVTGMRAGRWTDGEGREYAFVARGRNVGWYRWEHRQRELFERY